GANAQDTTRPRADNRGDRRGGQPADTTGARGTGCGTRVRVARPTGRRGRGRSVRRLRRRRRPPSRGGGRGLAALAGAHRCTAVATGARASGAGVALWPG